MIGCPRVSVVAAPPPSPAHLALLRVFDPSKATLMAYFRPQAHLRQTALGSAGLVDGAASTNSHTPGGVALLFVDAQNYNCHRDGTIYQSLSIAQREVRRKAAPTHSLVHAPPAVVLMGASLLMSSCRALALCTSLIGWSGCAAPTGCGWPAPPGLLASRSSTL